jgi:hypothetical protein
LAYEDGRESAIDSARPHPDSFFVGQTSCRWIVVKKLALVTFRQLFIKFFQEFLSWQVPPNKIQKVNVVLREVESADGSTNTNRSSGRSVDRAG